MSLDTAWNTLCEYIGDASSVILVSPYIKADALTKLLDRIPENSEIECYTRWKPRDIIGGASDVACRELIHSRNGAFYLHNSLHAKYYRLGAHILIGSANLTVSGLNIFGKGNFEILSGVNSFDWKEFEQRLSDESRLLNEAEMAFWGNLAVLKETVQLAPEQEGKDIADDWYPLTRNPSYLWLGYCGRHNLIPMDEQRDLVDQDLASVNIPPGLDEAQFHTWVGAAFYSSTLASEVLSTRSMSDSDSWRYLSEKWNVSIGVAERRKTTSLVWVDYFEAYLHGR